MDCRLFRDNKINTKSSKRVTGTSIIEQHVSGQPGKGSVGCGDVGPVQEVSRGVGHAVQVGAEGVSDTAACRVGVQVVDQAPVVPDEHRAERLHLGELME